MSAFVPTPVSESTAIEWRRVEGTAHSFKAAAVGSIPAGSLVKFGASGILQMIGTELDNGVFLGVTLYTATSGSIVTVARGQMRVAWDGAGTVSPGTLLVASATYSGMFTAGTTLSGGMSIGVYEPLPGTFANLAAANSGQLQLVRTI